MKNKIVNIYGEHLKNLKIGFLTLNNINSYKAPELISELRQFSCDVYPIIISNLKYVTNNILEWSSGNTIENFINKNYDAFVLYPVTRKMINNILNNNIKNQLIKNLIGNNNKAQVVLMTDEYINANIVLKLDKLKIKVVKSNIKSVVRALSKSNIKGINILVTAGPTPVLIDNVRRITNKFSGKLGIEIANELYLRGANVMLYQSRSGIRPPEYINHMLFDNYDEYKSLCVSSCSEYQYGIFSAAVADYKPKEVFKGKIPSGGAIKSIKLVQTDKVINLIRDKNPNLKMISFKYEEGKSLNQLLEIADKRLHNGHLRVVANDLTLNEKEQKCFLCGYDESRKVAVLNESEGKVNIARMIANDLEKIISNSS